MDNWNGPAGLLSAFGSGIIRTIICEQNQVADMVPIDIVINLMIVTAWRTGTTKSNEIKVYNCVTSKQNPITWKQFLDTSLGFMIRHPLEDVVWYPTSNLSTNTYLNMLHSYLVNSIPAYCIDSLAVALRRKPM